MASTPRRWLWIVNVFAIVLGAWLVAGTVDAMVASKVGAAPSLPASAHGATVAVAPTRPLDTYLGPIKARNIFNHGEAIPDEDVPVTPGQVTAPAGACTSNIALLSTVIAPKNPDLSLATIQDKSQTPPAIQVVQVGELLGDATVTGVTEEYDEDNLEFVSSLELTHPDGRKEICKSNDATTAGGSVAVSMPMGGMSAPAPNGTTIKRVDDGHYIVSQTEIDSVMNGGLANISQDVRIVPYFEGGVPKGFKMYSIKPGSLLAQIGLMNGDVIEKINGYDISSPEKALQVYSLLKNEKSVSVDLTRNGQNKSISYTIQ